ncbi:hypothetical protein E2C01_024805 [Portunus trituberculatus]|uniref:Uncharacterized protein n=1 Tax=Portunus trituberculatus TaxID=210409 RepID=A0A5B7EEU3_PORTR|nr:hypothetical protein [Portunus trituberculatus]
MQSLLPRPLAFLPHCHKSARVSDGDYCLPQVPYITASSSCCPVPIEGYVLYKQSRLAASPRQC